MSPGSAAITQHVEDLLAKARWRQEINRRGYEGRLPVASGRLAETLRAELREILDNNGKPFDLLVARHVYDFAIAAKDLLTVSVGSVDDAIKVIADNGGAMESLAGQGDPTPPEVASETFGARIMRELFALMPTALRKNNEDPLAIVVAIADARERGLHDLAAKLEQRLIGTPLETPKITSVEVVEDSYEHGFIEGSMQDNFERGVIDGHSGPLLSQTSPAYREGFEAGRARRLSKNDALALPQDLASPQIAASTNEHLRDMARRHHAVMKEHQAEMKGRQSESVRGIDVCAGCGDRACFNVCCHPSNKQREGQHSLPNGDSP